MMYMLLGAVYLHHLPQLANDFGIEPAAVMSDKGPHILVSAAVLAAPGLMVWVVDAGWRALAAVMTPAPVAVFQAAAGGSTVASGDPAAVAKAMEVLHASAGRYELAQSSAATPVAAPMQCFLELSYGFLPLVWAGTLAHYEELFMVEAGRILPVAAKTFGFEAPWLPTLVAHPAVVAFAQGVTLLFGTAASLGLLRRVARQPWKTIAPHCAVALLIMAELWHLIIIGG
jgi:hypothetical protein